MKYLISWFCYLLYSTLCSIIIGLHTVDISNVLSRMVEYNGCLVLVSVLMLIHYVLDVRLFPRGVKFYGLLSLSHSYVYTQDHWIDIFTVLPTSFHFPAAAFAGSSAASCLDLVVSSCSLCMLSLLSYHASLATPRYCRLELESTEKDFSELSCLL